MTDPPWPDDAATPFYELRLFVTGATARSQHAIANITRLCEAELSGRYSLDVIDVYTNPEATRDLQIVATPTLVKVTPAPLRRIVGDLSNADRVMAGLALVRRG